MNLQKPENECITAFRQKDPPSEQISYFEGGVFLFLGFSLLAIFQNPKNKGGLLKGGSFWRNAVISMSHDVSIQF